MGKKKGATLRANKRGREAAEELLADSAAQVENARVSLKADEELFVLDTKGDPNVQLPKATSSSKSEKEERRAKKQKLSGRMERKIKKLVDTHSAEGVQALVQRSKQRRSKRLAGTASANFDLWGSDSAELPAPAPKTLLPRGITPDARTLKASVEESMALKNTSNSGLSNKKKRALEARLKPVTKAMIASVEVAQPGQSYRPDAIQHQDAIGEALSIELRRNEAEAYKKTPLARGLTDETKRIMMGDSDDESDSDGDDSDADMEKDEKKINRKDKLTRAQRNRQKRVRAEQKVLEDKKRNKTLMNSVLDVKKYKKELLKDEREKLEHKKVLKELKKERDADPSTELAKMVNPEHALALPVALSSDLKTGNSLRTVKPKGSLLMDRVESMMVRKMANRKFIRDDKKVIVQGKKRSGKGREYILA
eukprot:scaffold2324_cov57-Attheya_sp.AAC.4